MTNSFLAQLHAERLARRLLPAAKQQVPAPRQQEQEQRQQQRQELSAASNSQPEQELRLLTYNLWFAEDVEVAARMAAVSTIIEQEGRLPHFLCLQEVTPLIYRLLQLAPWWGRYAGARCPGGAPYFTLLLWRSDAVQVVRAADISFDNSIMGRDLKCLSAVVAGISVTVATSHLESPCNGQLYSRQRTAQFKQAAELLERTSKGADVLFAGDMNWNDASDGEPPLPASWCDAWERLHPGDPGLTYDPRSNPMLNPGNRIRRRLDRALCRLTHWRLAGAELVGRVPLPALRHAGRPVLPSDHFGLLLRLVPA